MNTETLSMNSTCSKINIENVTLERVAGKGPLQIKQYKSKLIHNFDFL